jgi:3-methylfumaryl-CoA hydratase
MIDLTGLEAWVGRRQEARDEVTLPAVQRLAALLDLPSAPRVRGEALPAGWYAVLFNPIERQSDLGADGHPAKGQFLPPIPLPRRMFAGRRVEFKDELRIGDEVSRVSRIERIEPKLGRSGQMCFVTVRHEISSPRGLAIIEEQDLVYREPAGAAKRNPAPVAATEPADWSRTVVVDTTLLFRYSAVTFNAHRIHYDAAYTRDVEGYPDLVVNGGLTTLLLWEFAREKSGMQIRSSSTRNVKALYVNRPVTLCGRKLEGGKLRMRALDADGEPAIEAELELK